MSMLLILHTCSRRRGVHRLAILHEGKSSSTGVRWRRFLHLPTSLYQEVFQAFPVDPRIRGGRAANIELLCSAWPAATFLCLDLSRIGHSLDGPFGGTQFGDPPALAHGCRITLCLSLKLT